MSASFRIFWEWNKSKDILLQISHIESTNYSDFEFIIYCFKDMNEKIYKSKLFHTLHFRCIPPFAMGHIS